MLGGSGEGLTRVSVPRGQGFCQGDGGVDGLIQRGDECRGCWVVNHSLWSALPAVGPALMRGAAERADVCVASAAGAIQR